MAAAERAPAALARRSKRRRATRRQWRAHAAFVAALSLANPARRRLGDAAAARQRVCAQPRHHRTVMARLGADACRTASAPRLSAACQAEASIASAPPPLRRGACAPLPPRAAASSAYIATHSSAAAATRSSGRRRARRMLAPRLHAQQRAAAATLRLRSRWRRRRWADSRALRRDARHGGWRRRGAVALRTREALVDSALRDAASGAQRRRNRAQTAA